MSNNNSNDVGNKIRGNLNDLTSAERLELAGLIKNYVTPDVLKEHESWHNTMSNQMANPNPMHGSHEIHGKGTGDTFFSFHRNYNGKLDTWLQAKGKEKYTPVPFWEPSTMIPPEFSHPGRLTNTPSVPLPRWATLAGGIVPDPLFGHKSLGEFKSVDELGRAINIMFHAAVHNNIGGDMSTFKSPKDPIFFPWHAFLDDICRQLESMLKKSTKCFIATAAYGSELAPSVQFLREFRDDVVLQSRFRVSFAKLLELYYHFSPPIAQKMLKNKSFRNLIKYLVVWPFVTVLKVFVLIVKMLTKE